jgi:hypothetical protein
VLLNPYLQLVRYLYNLDCNLFLGMQGFCDELLELFFEILASIYGFFKIQFLL